MENLKRVFIHDIKAIRNSPQTFRDIYDIMFSHTDHIACESFIDYEMRCVTYAELKERICQFTTLLRTCHPDVSDAFIGIDLPNGEEFLVAFWGILQSGNKPYLINSLYPSTLKTKLLHRLEVPLVISDSLEYSEFMTIKTAALKEFYEYKEADSQWADEMAISSSLTGLEAKICIFDGRAVSEQILNSTGIVKKNNWLMLRYHGTMKILAFLPFFHIFGIIVSYFWFAFFGRTIVFLQNYSPDYIRGIIQRHHVTHIFAPPILYHGLYKGITARIAQESPKRKKQFRKYLRLTSALQNIAPYPGICLSKKIFKEIIHATFGPSVQFMITGGAFVEPDTLRLLNGIGYPLFNGYGTTETAITGVELRKAFRHRTSGSIGAPFDSVTYSLTEDQVLSISGNSICKKIISLDTEQSDITHILTNDIVQKINGHFFITGRKTDLFIGENGENISPDLIQNVLSVKNAARMSVLELNDKLSLVLEYPPLLPNLIIQTDIEGVKRDLQTIPYGLSVTDIYVTRDKIANDNAVKISRALLKRKIVNGEVRLLDSRDLPSEKEDASISRDNSVITLLIEIFQRALDTTADIDIHANFFFDLGGTSLDYFTMISDLSSSFNVSINLEQKNNLYTVADIYTYLKEVL